MTEMKLKKALVWGVTALVLGYFLWLILQATYGIWGSLLVFMGFRNPALKWMISCALTLAAAAVLGYGIMLAHPFRGIMHRLLKIKAREAKGVVLVKWGDIWFFGWLTGKIQIGGRSFYRVTVPSAPLPISGQLMLVPRERIIFINISMAEHMTQLASMGFNALPDKLRDCPPPDNNRCS